MKRVPAYDIIALFLATRLLLVLITYCGYVLLTAANYSSSPVDSGALLTSWNHWDAAHYTSIAQYGYLSAKDSAFFPLLPALMAILAYPLGGSSWSYLLAGTLISNIALLGAMFFLYQLAVDLGGEQVARRTLLYLCLFPTAFYFFAVYNESLFLLFTTGSFLAMRQQRWWLAGLLGLLAALTRSAGVLLFIPYLYEFWLARERTMVDLRTIVLRGLPVLLIPLGTLLYSAYCWKITGNPLSFMAVQSEWSRQLAWPWHGIWQNVFELFWNQPFGSDNQVHILLDLSATLAFITLAWIGRGQLRASYTLWAALLLLYINLSPTLGQHDALISNQRFVLEIFPGFIVLAMLGIKYPRLHQALQLAFPMLLATLSIVFILNRWMV